MGLRKGRTLAMAVVSVAGMGCLILFSQRAAEGVLQGLRLCGTVVIPSLFPFMVLSTYLTLGPAGQAMTRLLRRPLGLLFGLPREGAAPLVFGLLGGYPVGAATVCSLVGRNRLSRREANRMLCFCSNSGPGFFVGAVGTVLFHDPRLGLALYGIHLVSALCLALVLRQPLRPYAVRPVREQENAFRFTDAVPAACRTLFTVCGFILFFSGVIGMLRPLPVCNTPVGSLLLSTLELSNGITLLTVLPPDWAFCAAEMLVSFGGFCVHFQTISLLRQAGLSCRGYLMGKVSHGALSGIMALPVAQWIFYGNPQPTLYVIPAYLLLLVILWWTRKKSTGKGRNFSPSSL